jgi:hypothetical protein
MFHALLDNTRGKPVRICALWRAVFTGDGLDSREIGLGRVHGTGFRAGWRLNERLKSRGRVLEGLAFRDNPGSARETFFRWDDHHITSPQPDCYCRVD